MKLDQDESSFRPNRGRQTSAIAAKRVGANRAYGAARREIVWMLNAAADTMVG